MSLNFSTVKVLMDLNKSWPSTQARQTRKAGGLYANWLKTPAGLPTDPHPTTNPPPRQTLYRKMIIGNKLLSWGDNREQKGRQLSSANEWKTYIHTKLMDSAIKKTCISWWQKLTAWSLPIHGLSLHTIKQLHMQVGSPPRQQLLI
jgi:hypothetical protein